MSSNIEMYPTLPNTTPPPTIDLSSETPLTNVPAQVVMQDDVHDVSNVSSLRMYKCGMCMKRFCRSDIRWCDKNINDDCSGCKTTLYTTSETGACSCACAGNVLGICGLTFLCCSKPPMQCGSMSASSAMFAGMGTGYAAAVCCLFSMLGVYVCDSHGAACTRRCGCTSFSQGFEKEI